MLMTRIAPKESAKGRVRVRVRAKVRVGVKAGVTLSGSSDISTW